MKDPLTRSLLGLALAVLVGAWLVDAGGPTRLGLRDVAVEIAPGAYRLRAQTPSGTTLRWPGGLEEELPGGAWVSDWRKLPVPAAPVTLRLRHGPATLEARISLDPSGWPHLLGDVPRELATIATIQFPVALRGWSSLTPEMTARWARYGTTSDWGPGWPGGGSAVLPSFDAEVERDLLLAVHVLEGDAGSVELVTDTGERHRLGGPRWEPEPSRGPTSIRLVLPVAWMRQHGRPQALEPSADPAVRGRLRSVRLAWIGSPGDGSDLEECLVELRTYAALALEGWAPAEKRERVRRLALEAIERLEGRPLPRYPDGDLRMLDQVLRLVEALLDLETVLPRELVDYPGPLRFRGVVAALRSRGSGRRQDPFRGEPELLRDLRQAFRRTLPDPLDDIFYCWRQRFDAAVAEGRNEQTIPIFNSNDSWGKALTLVEPQHLSWEQGPTALARMVVLLFASRERGSLLGDRVAEAPAILEGLERWMETLPAGPVRDADLGLVRRVRESLRPAP